MFTFFWFLLLIVMLNNKLLQETGIFNLPCILLKGLKSPTTTWGWRWKIPRLEVGSKFLGRRGVQFSGVIFVAGGEGHLCSIFEFMLQQCNQFVENFIFYTPWKHLKTCYKMRTLTINRLHLYRCQDSACTPSTLNKHWVTCNTKNHFQCSIDAKYDLVFFMWFIRKDVAFDIMVSTGCRKNIFQGEMRV